MLTYEIPSFYEGWGSPLESFKPRYMRVLYTDKLDNSTLTQREMLAVYNAFDVLITREVFDVTGAGDTVISALTLAVLGSGVSLERAAMVANLAAGVVVGKTGTATVDGAEVLAYYDRLRTTLDASRS